MNRFIILFIVAAPIAALAQEEKKTRRLKAIGITFSPEYCYRDLSYSSENQWIAALRNDEERGNFGFNTNLLLQYSIQNKIKFEAGLSYANRSYRTKYKDLTWTSDDPALQSRSRTVYRFKYIGIPVNVRCIVLTENNFQVATVIGLSADLFMSRKTKVITDDTESASVKQVGNSKFNLSASIRVGADYRFAPRFSVRLEPFYQRSLNSIIEDPGAREYLYSFGVATGIQYSL